jgi:hypothetical protein
LIRIKPNGAGINILSLDGGGIRGIVQLEILRALEQALGDRIPVQRLFDLMVGSGTGGLIAVALAKEGQTVNGSLDMFMALCRHAYRPRWMPAEGSPYTFKSGALMSRILKSMHPGPRCNTESLHAALKVAFVPESNFFGSTEQFAAGARVAVTSARGGHGGVTILANYRRPDGADALYSLQRTHDPTTELKTWECVAAATADPTYFKPLVSQSNAYVEAGLDWTNPIKLARQEAGMMWSGVVPDICLSLGTGQHKKVLVDKLRRETATFHAPNSASFDHVGEERTRRKRWRSGQRDDVLEAELAWHTFKVAPMKQIPEKGLIRLNLDLGEDVPAPDRLDRIEALQTLVRKELQVSHRRIAVRNLAYRLVATSFYLDVRNHPMDGKGTMDVLGSICCRLEEGSPETKGLGKILHQAHNQFEPFFQVRVDSNTQQLCFNVAITKDHISRMIDDGMFEQLDVVLRLQAGQGTYSINLFASTNDTLEPEGFPLSGFPRHISRCSMSHSLQSRRSFDSMPGTELTHECSIPSETLMSRRPTFRRGSNGDRSTEPHPTRSAAKPRRPLSLGVSESAHIQAEGNLSRPDAAIQTAEVTTATSNDARSATRTWHRRASCVSSTKPLKSQQSRLCSPELRSAGDAHDSAGSWSGEVRSATALSSDGAGWNGRIRPSQLSQDRFGDGFEQPRCSIDDARDSPRRTIFEEDDDFYYDLVEKKLMDMSSAKAEGARYRSQGSDTLSAWCDLYT